MVSALRQQGIRNDRVLSAMGRVPRHIFVAAAFRNRAYDETEAPTNYGETINSPYAVAVMLQTLQPAPHCKVLAVATGAGYETAVLAEMGARVYAVERRREVAKAEQIQVRSLGYRDVHFASGDDTEGWAKFAPYDAILVAEAQERVPMPLVKQLDDGGCMVITVGRGPERTLNRITKNAGRIRADVIALPRVALRTPHRR
jgi:protein-L-isoaspartate(D-aspartate) O-methyltransferase